MSKLTIESCKKVIEINIKGVNGVDGYIASAFLKALQLKGEDLFHHSVQVGLIAEQIGIALGFNQKKIKLLKLSGLLHDIGKLAICNEILFKAASPDRNEWEQIRLHPELGAGALQDFHCFEVVSKIVLYHHEQDDGNGYPHGIKGDVIPFESKIIRICDMFSAVTSERPYKPSYPRKLAVTISMQSVGIDGTHRCAIEGVLSQISLKMPSYSCATPSNAKQQSSPPFHIQGLPQPPTLSLQP